MNQNFEKSSSTATKEGPVWSFKIKIGTALPGNMKNKKKQTKLWKVKEILN